MTFGTATFSKELLSRNTFNLKVSSFGVLLFLGTATFKRIYLKHHVFVKKIDFSQSTTSSRPFFKVVCYFIYRENWRPVIHFLIVAFLKRAAWAIHHLWWFFYRSGRSHPFFQGLYRTDIFWQQLLIKTLIKTTTYYYFPVKP